MTSARIIITFPYSLNMPGGGTVHCLAVAKHLAKMGARVTLVPVSAAPSPRLDFDAAVSPARPSAVHFLLDGWAVRARVAELLRADRHDAVLSWSHEAAFLPGLLRRAGVVFAMISAHPSYRAWFHRCVSFKVVKKASDAWFRWRPLRMADIVFPPSEFTRSELADVLGIEPARMVTAPCGIAPIFGQIPRPHPTKVANFLFFGDFTKGLADALEAMARAMAGRSDEWQLRIAGWGDQASAESQAHRLGISAHVAFLGRLDHVRLAQELAWAHVAVLPSPRESFGLAIAEAQASGLPVISYRLGSIPEVVEDGRTGWLVPPGCIDLLADRIREAIAAPDRVHAMGCEARARATARFSWDRAAQTILTRIAEKRP